MASVRQETIDTIYGKTTGIAIVNARPIMRRSDGHDMVGADAQSHGQPHNAHDRRRGTAGYAADDLLPDRQGMKRPLSGLKFLLLECQANLHLR